MSIAKKLLVMSLALTLALSGVFASCSKALSAEEISAKTIAASPKVDTFRMDMNMTATADTAIGKNTVRVTILQDAAAWVKNAAKEMKLTMTVSADLGSLGKQNISMEMYMLDAWIYLKADLLGQEQWEKMDLTDELWEAQNQMAQLIEFLKTAVEVTLLGSEKVDGVDCYILQINPDMAALTEWALKQQQSSLDLSNFDLAFKSSSIKEWIAKDSYLPVKEEVTAIFEITLGDIGAGAGETGKVSMDMKAQMKFYDYNKPVTIELPSGALNALEIPSN